MNHALTSFETQKYYQNEPKLNGVYSRKNLRYCVINLDEYKLIKAHWIAWYVNAENVTYFDSCWVEEIPKKIHREQKYKNTNTLEYKHTIR